MPALRGAGSEGSIGNRTSQDLLICHGAGDNVDPHLRHERTCAEAGLFLCSLLLGWRCWTVLIQERIFCFYIYTCPLQRRQHAFQHCNHPLQPLLLSLTSRLSTLPGSGIANACRPNKNPVPHLPWVQTLQHRLTTNAGQSSLSQGYIRHPDSRAISTVLYHADVSTQKSSLKRSEMQRCQTHL